MAGSIQSSMLEKRPLFMVMDGHSLVHRGFHALDPLTVSRTGETVHAVYAFTNALLKSLEEIRPTHCAIAFDRPSPTFRHLQFADYNMVSSCGAFLFGFSQLLFLFIVIKCIRGGAKASDQVWEGAHGLEWTVP